MSIPDLKDTKVGDKLIVNHGWGCDVVIVTRTTKTQVICGNSRFNRRGFTVGASRWTSTYAHPATDKEVDEVKDENRRRRLVNEISSACSRSSLDKLTTDQLETIHKLFVRAHHE